MIVRPQIKSTKTDNLLTELETNNETSNDLQKKKKILNNLPKSYAAKSVSNAKVPSIYNDQIEKIKKNKIIDSNFVKI